MHNTNQQPQPPPPPPPLPLPPPHLICDNCELSEQSILHNIIKSPKSPPQKLCTACVLHRYRTSCCAQCFVPYDAVSLTPPPLAAAAATTGNNRLLPCIRCENWSHFACPGPKIPKSPYLCPPCMSPNYRYFDWSKRGKGREMKEKDAAMQLVGASRIAVITVAKAAAAARIEAERRAKEAALARIRAREAIERVVSVADKVRNSVHGDGVIVTVPEPIAVVMPQQEQEKKAKCVAVVDNGNVNGNGGGSNAAAGKQ